MSPTATPEKAPETQPEVSEIALAEESVDEAIQALREKAANRQRTVAALEPKRLLQRFEAFLIPGLILFMLGNALTWALPGLPFAQMLVGIPLILILAGLMIYSISKQGRPWTVKLSLWLIVLIIGSLYHQLFHFQPGKDDVSHLTPEERAEVMGRIRYYSGDNKVVLQVTDVNGKSASGQVLATLPEKAAPDDGSPLEAGTRVMILGDLVKPYDNPVPGAFNQARYLHSQQITALLKRPERLIAFETSNQAEFILQRMADGLKLRVSEAFRQGLPSPHAELLGGIVLGDKAIPVDRETRQAFVDTGLVHILAASGMNVGIIAAAVLWLVSLLKIPYRARLGIAMAAVAMYSLLTGLPPSIQRAACMLELALLLKMVNRELSPVFLLCVASTLLVLTHPDHIASIGFQFSVLTTFGLIAMVPPLQEKLGYYITRWLAGMLLVPAVAQLWIWPLSIYYFNQFPLHTVPLNMLAILLVAPLTVLGFTAGLLSMLSLTVGSILALVSYPFLSLLLGLVQWGDSMAWAKWSLASPSGWLVFSIYAELLILQGLLYGPKHWPLKRRALATLAPVMLILAGLCMQQVEAGKQATVDMLPLSWRQEAYLVKPAGQHNSYIAILPSDIGYLEGRTFADFLRHHNITRLQAVLLLPGEADADSQGLKAALKKAKADLFLVPGGTSLPKGGMAVSVKNYPPRGAKLQISSLSVEGELSALRLFSKNACLLSVDTRYRSDSDCAVQAVHDGDSNRLYPDKALSLEMENNRYYRLVHRKHNLAVY